MNANPPASLPRLLWLTLTARRLSFTMEDPSALLNRAVRFGWRLESVSLVRPRMGLDGGFRDQFRCVMVNRSMIAKILNLRGASHQMVEKVGSPQFEGTSKLRSLPTKQSSATAPHPLESPSGSRKSSAQAPRFQPSASGTESGSIGVGKRFAAKVRAMLRWRNGASEPSSPPADGPARFPTGQIECTPDLLDWFLQQAQLSAANYPAAIRRMQSLEDRMFPATEPSPRA